MDARQRVVRFVESRSARQLFIVLFLLTIVVRVGLFFALHRQQVILRSEVEHVALSLAQDGSFGGAYHIPTGPTAHVAPIYPYVLSFAYRLFGTGIEAEWADQSFSVLCVAVVFGLLPLLSLWLAGSNLCGTVAGLIGALSPSQFLTETQGKEAPFVSLLFLLLIFVTAWLVQKPVPKRGDAAVYGLCWGILLLTYPGFLLVMLGFVVLAFYYLPIPRRRMVALAAIWLICTGLVLVPWTVRNYERLGKVFFIRDNFGLELSVSNNANAFASAWDNMAHPESLRHPWGSQEEAERVIALGEYRYMESRRNEAIHWIQSNPSRFLKLTLERVVQFWFPYRSQKYRLVISGAINLAAFAGFLMLFGRRPRLAMAVLTIWILYALPYALVQADDRYRYPIDWVLYLMAAYTVVHFFLVTTKRSQNIAINSIA